MYIYIYIHYSLKEKVLLSIEFPVSILFIFIYEISFMILDSKKTNVINTKFENMLFLIHIIQKST